MLKFDPTVSLGTIVAILGIVGGLSLTIWRVAVGLRSELQSLKASMQRHDQRLDVQEKKQEKQDEALLGIVRTLERLIGRLEATSSSSIADAASAALRVVREAETAALTRLETARGLERAT